MAGIWTPFRAGRVCISIWFGAVVEEGVAIDAHAAGGLAIGGDALLVVKENAFVEAAEVTLPERDLVPLVDRSAGCSGRRRKVDPLAATRFRTVQVPPAAFALRVDVMREFAAGVGFEQRAPSAGRDAHLPVPAEDLDGRAGSQRPQAELRPGSRIFRFSGAMFGGMTVPE